MLEAVADQTVALVVEGAELVMVAQMVQMVPIQGPPVQAAAAAAGHVIRSVALPHTRITVEPQAQRMALVPALVTVRLDQ